MKCTEFRLKLAAFIADDLEEKPRQQCLEHLLNCVDCLDTWLTRCPDRFRLNEKAQNNLVDSLLRQLVSKQCQEIEKLLVEFVDQQLDTLDTQAVSMHLDNCSSCKATVQQLNRLKLELPQLKLPEPPPDLTESVLRKTLPWYKLRWRNNPIAKINIRGLLLRPRFSMEASFVATLFWLAFFGLPNNFSSVAIAEQINTTSSAIREITSVQSTSYVQRIENEMTQLSAGVDIESMRETGNRLVESSRQKGNEFWRSFTELMRSDQSEN